MRLVDYLTKLRTGSPSKKVNRYFLWLSVPLARDHRTALELRGSLHCWYALGLFTE